MHCPMFYSLAKCSCCGMRTCPFCIALIVVTISVIFGTLLAWKPKKAIEIQIALYRPFNWKIEPISMKKEIRNMRIMGLVVAILGAISLVYIFLYY